MTAPCIDLGFPHRWQAEILTARPLILPPRHFTYPSAVEEAERGALEILIQPQAPGAPDLDSQTWESDEPKTRHAGAPGLDFETGDNNNLSNAQPFLATCALGFRDPLLPSGVWSTPNPDEICAVAGGYAYIIDTRTPERFTMLPYRPVFAVLPAIAQGLLLIASNLNILAWGANGQAWESPKLSDEGLTLTGIDGDTLHGCGWSMETDKETAFRLNLSTGQRHD